MLFKNEKVNVFGIRHHGPGSARSLLKSLQQLQPDCILVEGPPDANHILPHILSEQMQPPVALLLYAQDDIRRAVYYPFAVFSPEWQALKYGLEKGLPVRFMDLPLCHRLAIERAKYEADVATAAKKEEEQESADPEKFLVVDGDNPNEEKVELSDEFNIRLDPLSWLAKAAGYDDSERWWENLVEHRREDLDVFAAIREAMATLRNELSEDELYTSEFEALREAHMRQTIRAALKEGFQRIAVVCGAWHAPVLSHLPAAKEDQAILKGLPKLKIEATWIPWTHRRLAMSSGYGAGVRSPGWYHHLWTCNDLVVERWLATVARLLRQKDLDASSAHIIESVRLAEALASMRGQPLPGLEEISEATQAVLCFGNPVPLKLIQDQLVVGDMMGEVPPELPGTPLQKDLEKEQKRLRLPVQAAEKVFDLDLRNANDLQRSHLFHRLEILGLEWGVKEEVSGKSGSFHEIWRLRWKPEFVLVLIEASVWGKGVEEASSAFACDLSEKASELLALTELLDRVLFANLPNAVDHVMHRVQNEAAVAVDIKHLMAALPSLVQIARYGNVRKTDISAVAKIIDGLLSRICVGLPSACSSIDEAAAQQFFELMGKVHSAVGLLQNAEHEDDWEETLSKLADGTNINGIISGRACRMLFDKKIFDSAEASRRFGLALSTATEAIQAAAWAEGFLKGSGLVLIHDAELLGVIDQWVQTLNDETFTQILPLLRRTFSSYTPPERRQIGERVARRKPGQSASRHSLDRDDIDVARAERVLPVLSKLLGLTAAANAEGKSE